MYGDKTVAVVVPAKNEGRRILAVLADLDPMVDRVFVVNDGSTDQTGEIVRRAAEKDRRIDLIDHPKSRGVGAAIGSGYRRALQEGVDVTVVVAGDGQMDPGDFETVVSPVAKGLTDYCKGNRFTFARGVGLSTIPFVRRCGNFVLSMLTKIVSGYWHVSDTQCGYTAISAGALAGFDLEKIYPRYGCPNDILVQLNIAEMRVAEVPVRPVYNVGEESKMRVPFVLLPIMTLLGRRFVERLVQKYVIRNGHPLVFAYLFAFLFLLGAQGLGVYLVVMFFKTGLVMMAALTACGFMLMVGIQLLVSAFSMDSSANYHLCVQVPGARPGIRDATRSTGPRQAVR